MPSHFVESGLSVNTCFHSDLIRPPRAATLPFYPAFGGTSRTAATQPMSWDWIVYVAAGSDRRRSFGDQRSPLQHDCPPKADPPQAENSYTLNWLEDMTVYLYVNPVRIWSAGAMLPPSLPEAQLPAHKAQAVLAHSK